MRILLPPSEAKRPGGDGPALGLSGPRREAKRPGGDGPPLGLSGPRREVARAIKALIRADPAGAAAALLLPAAVRDDALAANRILDRSPTMAALDRYDGVLYRALDPGSLTAPQRRRADESVLIFSGLLGVVGGADPVPLYRVPAAAVVPGVGHLGRFWRAHLDLDLAGELVVDLRSSDYLSMWKPPAGTVAVRFLNDAGRAVSYTGKQGKGLLVRALLQKPARRVEDVVAAGERLGCRPRKRGANGLDFLVGREGFEPP